MKPGKRAYCRLISTATVLSEAIWCRRSVGRVSTRMVISIGTPIFANSVAARGRPSLAASWMAASMSKAVL